MTWRPLKSASWNGESSLAGIAGQEGLLEFGSNDHIDGFWERRRGPVVIEMPVAQNQCFDVLDIDVAIWKDIDHVLGDFQARDPITQQAHDVRDRIIPVFAASEIEEKLLSSLVVLDVE